MKTRSDARRWSPVDMVFQVCVCAVAVMVALFVVTNPDLLVLFV